MFEADTTTSDVERTIQVDTEREIAYLSMRIDSGVKFDGIRLYDEAMNYIVDVTWNSWPSPTSKWSDLYAIPEGQQIIGVSCNATEEEIDYNIRSL